MKINRVIKILITSDLLFLSAWGLITPILAIFVVERIEGGTVQVAGFAAGIYWIGKALMQLPVGLYLDKNRGEKDDFHFLFWGTILSALTPFCFLFATLPWHIYLIQIIYALGMSMAIPAWSAIFTRHIDKGKEAFEWSLESTVLSFGVGAAGAAGGMLAAKFGFDLLFISVGILALAGSILILLIYRDIFPRDGIFPRAPHRREI